MDNRASGPHNFLMILLGVAGLVVLAVYLYSIQGFSSSDGSMASSTATTSTIVESPASSTISYATTTIHAQKGNIQALIADTPEKMQLGLGNRDSLPADAGMIFPYESPGVYEFWMKDMHFSIDMVWINADKKVVGVEKAVSPDTFPQTYLPPVEISYVLELNAGFAEKLGIQTGSVLEF